MKDSDKKDTVEIGSYGMMAAGSLIGLCCTGIVGAAVGLGLTIGGVISIFASKYEGNTLTPATYRRMPQLLHQRYKVSQKDKESVEKYTNNTLNTLHAGETNKSVDLMDLFYRNNKTDLNGLEEKILE